MKNSILAAIDIGTNTFRLLIAKLHKNPVKNKFEIVPLRSERVITRLGSGISENNLLDHQAIERGIKTLKLFSNTISSFNVDQISAAATSALRKAENNNEFIKRAKQSANIDIRIISGEEEANLTATGMTIDIDSGSSSLMVDIGGGSTEIIVSKDMKTVSIFSLDLGVVYLTEKYMKSDPPSEEELNSLEKEILQTIDTETGLIRDLIDKETIMIGTAGTITTLAAISQQLNKFSHDKVHKYKLTTQKVSELFTTLSTVTSEERSGFIPFESERLDIIVPGTLILLKLLEVLGFNELTVSNYGLMEGLLIDIYNE